jgi:cytochrome b
MRVYNFVSVYLSIIPESELMSENETVRVWDIAIRLFHWSLVTAFSVAYISSGDDDLEFIHTYAGYIIGGLLVFRLVWGFVGTKYARFSSFLFSPQTTIQYLKGMLSGKTRHYLGHNPVAAAMVFLLLVSLTCTVFAGLKTYAADGKGPLAVNSISIIPTARADDGNKNERGKHKDHFWKEIHEFFGNLTLILVGFHVAGVILSSRLEHQNLAKAMLTGRKKIE